MLGLLKKRREKLGITYFGLLAHEVASLRSMMNNAENLDAEYELREPNQAGTCGIVVVNKDNRLAKSWWNSYKTQHPSALPLFLTDSNDEDEDAYCKRPFTPSVIQAAFRDLVRASVP